MHISSICAQPRRALPNVFHLSGAQSSASPLAGSRPTQQTWFPFPPYRDYRRYGYPSLPQTIKACRFFSRRRSMVFPTASPPVSGSSSPSLGTKPWVFFVTINCELVSPFPFPGSGWVALSHFPDRLTFLFPNFVRVGLPLPPLRCLFSSLSGSLKSRFGV